MNSSILLADDGLPYVTHDETLRTRNGDIWRVKYHCGSVLFQITIFHGFCVLAWVDDPGYSRENTRDNTRESFQRRYTTFDRAYKGILSLRRKLCA